MSDLVALLVGACIGIVVTISILWRRREEVGKAWRRRGGGSKPMQTTEGSTALRHKRLTIGIHVLAGLGAAFVAVISDDGAVRAASLLVFLLAAASVGALLLQSRRSA